MNNEIIVNDVDKAEAFNDYFGSISHVIDANAAIDEPVTSTDYELSSITITCQDVLLNLKLNKACGLDMINHRLLKESVNIISKPLTCIFNKVWEDFLTSGRWLTSFQFTKQMKKKYLKTIDQFHY